MKKTILIISLIFSLIAVPRVATAESLSLNDPESVFAVQNDVKIIVRGNTLRITGAAGMVVDIYNVTGQKVKSIRLGANDETINTGLPRGCYIVKVGDLVRKVSLG
ncbi:MAG: T9SS type A sorting domain-containing protein [Bacteroidaceae bacterium]|nr:T9SS type A sorting domain-containing protein [Bacteroidaceae bacterium]